MQEGLAPTLRVHDHSWIKRIAVVTLVVANLLVFAGLLYLRSLEATIEGSVEQIPVEQLPALAPPEEVDEGGGSAPLYLLLVGSDSREDLESNENLDFSYFADFGGRRADVIMLLRLDPDTNTAKLVSLPRDLKVAAPGGGIEKINAAYARDANDLIHTVSEVGGVRVNHYVEVDFAGFANIVDALGGVTLFFEHPSRDIKSGLDVPAGEVEMNGAMALAYARSRNFQELIDGSWRSDGGSDIERTRRQQQLLFAILDEAKKPSNLLDTRSLVAEVAEELTTDSEMDFDLIVDLAWEWRGFGVEDLETATLPVGFSTVDGVSYVAAVEPQASTLLEAFRTGEPLGGLGDRPSSVDVLNANGVAGIAGETAARLEAMGYRVREVGNADRSDYPTTLVVTRPDALARGRALAEDLGFGVVQAAAHDIGSDIVVYLGADAVSGSDVESAQG